MTNVVGFQAVSPQEVWILVLLTALTVVWCGVGIVRMVQIARELRQRPPPDEDSPEIEGDNYDPDDPGDWWKKRPKQRV